MDNLDMMRNRLQFQGGIDQESRMIHGKYLTFKKTLLYSYQGCDVTLVQPKERCLDVDLLDTCLPQTYPQYRALINPDKIKQDYDDKILSVDYATGYKEGDIIKWIGTDTNWIIHLRALTEDAYFRGEIRRCKHLIKFRDEEGNFLATWAAIRGPVETQIDSIQKNRVRIDRPNLGLNILIPYNEKTREAFERYKEFMFDGRCWRVEAPDAISISGVLDINAEECYKDRDTDTDDIKNGLVIEPIDPTPNSEIQGETFIKPQITELYYVPYSGGRWCIVESDRPVQLKLKTTNTVEVTWQKMTSGQFTLRWHKDDKEIKKTIVVESLF